MEQVALRSCGCHLPGSVQDQAEWSSEQPGLVEDVPAHGREVGTRWSLRSLPTLTILWFYDSMFPWSMSKMTQVVILPTFSSKCSLPSAVSPNNSVAHLSYFFYSAPQYCKTPFSDLDWSFSLASSVGFENCMMSHKTHYDFLIIKFVNWGLSYAV